MIFLNMNLVVSPWLKILIAASISCFIPYFLNLKIQSSSSADIFVKSFGSSFYFDSHLIAVAVSIPMWFDFLFDIIHYRDSFRQDHFSRTLLLSGIAVPNIITLLYITPQSNLNLILGFLRLKEVLYIVYFLAYMYNFGGPIWTDASTYELAFFLLSSEMAQSLYPFMSGITLLVLKALTYTLYAYSALRMCKLSHYWFRHLGNRMLKLRQDEYRCTVFILAGLLAFIGSRMIDLCFGIGTYLDLREVSLIVHTIFLVLLTAVINMFTTRIARREMVLYNQILQMQNMSRQMQQYDVQHETAISFDTDGKSNTEGDEILTYDATVTDHSQDD